MHPNPDRREFVKTAAAATLAAGAARPAGRAALPSADMLFEDNLVYFGTATLGPCARPTVEAVARAMYDLERNPTTMAYGGAMLEAADRVRQQAAELLGCTMDEIGITRSTTDGMNAVAQGLRLQAGQRVIITDQEHPGGRSGWDYLAQKQGVGLDVIPIPIGENDGPAIVDRIARAITPATRAISISHVLTSTGFLVPIADIARLARSRGVLLIVDGAQAAGNIAVDVKSLGCHAYATSGHKWLMGPKGTGLLYLSNEPGNPIEPMQYLDSRRYYSESSGVGNMPGVIGLGVAIASLRTTGMAAVEQHNIDLRNRLYAGLRQIAGPEVVSAAPGRPGVSSLITFRLPDRLESRATGLRLLNEHHLMVKVVPKEWLNGLRLSPHIYNTPADVEFALAALRSVLA